MLSDHRPNEGSGKSNRKPFAATWEVCVPEEIYLQTKESIAISKASLFDLEGNENMIKAYSKASTSNKSSSPFSTPFLAPEGISRKSSPSGKNVKAKIENLRNPQLILALLL